MSKPWFKFYPSDWRADPALRLCSMGARGLWLELICLMDEATPRGYLLVAGQRPSPKQIASLVGCESREAAGYMRELEDRGVFSRRQDGVIFSRKLVRETRFSDEQSARRAKSQVVDNVEQSIFGGTKSATKETRDQNPETRIQTKAIATAIWDEAPLASRRRSSKAGVEAALTAATKRGKNLAAIRRALGSYFADPQIAREDHRYAKGVHRMIADDRWEEWAQAEGVEHIDTEFEKRRFRTWMQDWIAKPYQWREQDRGPPPNHPGCRIPPEIIAEFQFEQQRAAR